MRIDLIANSSIQFHTIHLNLEDGNVGGHRMDFAEQAVRDDDGTERRQLLFPFYWEDHDLYIDKESINVEAYNTFGRLVPERIRKEYVTEIDIDEVYKCGGDEALRMFTGHWVPLPYLRRKDSQKAKFHPGPQAWCRMMLTVSDKPGCTHAITLAFDTKTIAPSEANAAYWQPLDSDATPQGTETFQLVTEERHAPHFFTSKWVNDWMFNLYELFDFSVANDRPLRHLAMYHVILNMLERAEGFPEVSLLSGVEGYDIDVGLVLDIGNSRTCGLMVETSSLENQAIDLTNARILEIRDLTRPDAICDDPFEMQVAFAQERFGNKAMDFLPVKAFDWPSLVRVGPEAIRLTSQFESEDAPATMSSPKRYLWDRDPVRIPWVKVDRDSQMGYDHQGHGRKQAVFGASSLLTDDGKVIRDRDKDKFFPATESRYSRGSLMTFALFEIVLQALSQINSVHFRKGLGNSTYRRVLKDVIVTCPTAMPIQEQFHLRKALEDAMFMVEQTVGDQVIRPDLRVVPPVPDLRSDEDRPWSYDEATCSQLTYLYGELAHKFNGAHHLFFQVNGKKRSGDRFKGHPSMTIASVDIGGGTTDLMICNYQSDPTAEVPYVHPRPLFWEGFNIAGDDIVRRIAEFVLFPALAADLTERGGRRVLHSLNAMFGPNIGGHTAHHRMRRKQFANQVVTLFAYAALDLLSDDQASGDDVRFSELFTRYGPPEASLLAYVNDFIREQTGIADYCIEQVTVELRVEQIERGIRDVMEPVIRQMTHLIAQFDVDQVLLSGRPSRLPIIREMFVKQFAFSPDRILCFGDYRTGPWYPFDNETGFILKDPKTTVSVGALLAYLNSINRLPHVRFEAEGFDAIRHRAEVVGVMDVNRSTISQDHRVLGPDQRSGAFRFYGERVVLGAKQLEDPDWIASAIYSFDYKDDQARDRALTMGLRSPFEVSVRVEAGLKDLDLRLEDLEVVDSEGEGVDVRQFFRLDFQTIANPTDYWRESGSFIIQID